VSALFRELPLRCSDAPGRPCSGRRPVNWDELLAVDGLGLSGGDASERWEPSIVASVIDLCEEFELDAEIVKTTSTGIVRCCECRSDNEECRGGEQ